MDKWLRSPWFVRVISLMIAVLLWMSANLDSDTTSDALLLNDGNNDLEVLSNIPLDLRYDDEQFTITGVPQYVNVTLEGPTSAMTPHVRQKNFEVFIDLEDIDEPGTYQVNVQHSGISNRLNVTLDPATLEVTVTERTSADFDVSVDFINDQNLIENYTVGEPTVEPGQVTITGSQDLVNRVALVKAMVDVTNVTESIDQIEAPVKVYDSQGNELNVLVDPNRVDVSVPIDLPTATVPIEVQTTGELPDGYALGSVTPNTQEVTITGPQTVLDEIESISDLEVDISELTETTTVDVDIPLPDGVQSVEPETVQVEVVVTEAEQAEETIDNIEVGVDNLQDGQTIDFLNPEDQLIEVVLKGDPEALEQVTAEDLQAFIDVDGLESGEHEVPIQLETPENVEAQVSTENATVRIG
ncbi:CdaR family protein [Thalassobacillus hwangdonensis]|uniref:YbbR-like domain-containing protein n=1 Tax=Thalassobacillus hwangdonensis TaxID=546108 RepID=A0ABW3KZN6_9BACI